jgi:hypothetical protein
LGKVISLEFSLGKFLGLVDSQAKMIIYSFSWPIYGVLGFGVWGLGFGVWGLGFGVFGQGMG